MRKLIHVTATWLLTCTIWINVHAQNGSLSLKQCVEIALNNNIPVKQNELLAQSAKADWQKAKANLLPDLNADWGYGWNQGRAFYQWLY